MKETKTKKDYNAGDEELVKDVEKDAKNKREQELEDIKQLLGTPFGVRFMRRIMDEGKIFHTTFTGNSNSYFLEGHRNFALKFFNDVCEAAPQKLQDLLVLQK